MDVRALAISAFVHACAAAMLGRGFLQRPASRETASADAHARAFAFASDVEIDVDAPKARPNGSLAGSDLAGALRASGPNRALAGSRGDESTAEGTLDARFGMVALVDASREVSPAGSDATWAPRAGGGADGLYAGAALGDGVGVSGLGIGAAHDGLGVGLGSTGTLGLTGRVPGALASEPAWNDATWHGAWTGEYAHVHRWYPRPGPHITHPTRLSPIGPLDGTVVRRIVRIHDYALVHCYTKALETRADLAGELRIDFMTDRSGAVVAVKDGGGSVAYDYALVTCMTKAFEAFEFPTSTALTRVAYAMELHPR